VNQIIWWRFLIFSIEFHSRDEIWAQLKGTSYSRISILTIGDWNLSWLKELCCDFSPCHSSNQIRREVRPSLKLHKMLFRISTLCEISGPLTVWCWLLLSVRSKMSDRSQLWSLHFQPSFQHLNRGRSRTQRGDILDSIEDDGDGFFPGQRHDIVSAILAQCALYQQSLDSADIAARDSWAHLSRWRDNAPDWKNEICWLQPPIGTTSVLPRQDSNWSSSVVVGL